MSVQLTTLYRFTLNYCEALMADIPQDQMEQQPSPGVNPPAWILGHLAICTDSALTLMGQPKRLPEEWHAEFGPRTKPLSENHAYPDREELLIALREGHEAVSAALLQMTPEQLTAPNPLPMKFLRQSLPTVGDLLAHLVSTHEAAHLGHLSNWRRQMGKPPLF